MDPHCACAESVKASDGVQVEYVRQDLHVLPINSTPCVSMLLDEWFNEFVCGHRHCNRARNGTHSRKVGISAGMRNVHEDA